MKYLPRYTLALFVATAMIGVVFIASANVTHDETSGFVFGESVEPEGSDIVAVEPVKLPENVLKQAELPRNDIRYSINDTGNEYTTLRTDAVTGNVGAQYGVPLQEKTLDNAQDNATGKKIVIRLKSQTMEMVEEGTVLNSFKISSGKKGMQTPTGTFNVLNKTPRAYSKTYGLYMPFWMAFTTRGHGIHELPEWPNGYKEGENYLGTPVSHGCVRLGVGQAKTMYEWADVGTPVEVVP